MGHIVAGTDVLDEAVVCRRDGLIEINIHGGPAVARALLELLAAQGVTIAPPGGLAEAAFPLAHPRWNNPAIGAELLAALPGAKGPRVVAALTRQWSAGLSELARGDRPAPTALRDAAGGLARMRRLLDPAEVVLVGAPNAGKSTLANALVGRPVSVVHETPGTTRDWVRELALLDGVPVWLTDTAGLWEAEGAAGTAGAIDAEAVRRARLRAESADLVLLTLRAEAPAADPPWLHARHTLRVATQCDRAAPAFPADACVSGATGQGLDNLKTAILRALGVADLDPAAPMAFTDRQARLLLQAADEPARSALALSELLEGV